MRSEIEPTSSWILVRFVSPVPQWELLSFHGALITYPGSMTNWEEKKERKNWGKKNPETFLFATLVLKVLEPHEEKLEDLRIFSQINIK